MTDLGAIEPGRGRRAGCGQGPKALFHIPTRYFMRIILSATEKSRVILPLRNYNGESPSSQITPDTHCEEEPDGNGTPETPKG